jgi:peroxiredoxin
VGDKVMLLADGNGEFTKSAGLDSDMSHKGLGVRCLRYAMIVDDMVVKVLNIESEESQFQVSGADNMLEAIDKLKLTSRAVA